MQTLIFGALVLVIVLWGLDVFKTFNPKKLAGLLRPLGGVLGLAVAGFLGLRGQLELAIPLGAAALGMLGWGPFANSKWFQRGAGGGQASRARSTFIEMELDHDSGAMRGRVLAGVHQGRALDSLDLQTLLSLMDTIDAESQALLAAYLDRRVPGWREHPNSRAAPGAGRGGKMTEQEAYQILGLHPGAGADEIGRAHRALMKKLHPDQGGTTYLAAKINEAKEILLRLHR